MQTGSDNISRNRFIRSVTEFIFVEDAPRMADVIFVPGSTSVDHAQRAAQLYTEGYAPYILPSGKYAIGLGEFHQNDAELTAIYGSSFETECDFLKSVLIKHGVPEDAVLCENRATYTWQNAQFSRQLTDDAGIQVSRAILCCKPWHARRALFYYQAAYPDAMIYVCPAECDTVNRYNWFKTQQGRYLVLGELTRCGNQLNDVFESVIDSAEEG